MNPEEFSTLLFSKQESVRHGVAQLAIYPLVFSHWQWTGLGIYVCFSIASGFVSALTSRGFVVVNSLASRKVVVVPKSTVTAWDGPSSILAVALWRAFILNRKNQWTIS